MVLCRDVFFVENLVRVRGHRGSVWLRVRLHLLQEQCAVDRAPEYIPHAHQFGLTQSSHLVLPLNQLAVRKRWVLFQSLPQASHGERTREGSSGEKAENRKAAFVHSRGLNVVQSGSCGLSLPLLGEGQLLPLCRSVGKHTGRYLSKSLLF